MDKFFYPESVAVVGVSPSATNLAKRILFNLKRFDYQGRIYAVGPQPDEVEGFEPYPSVLAIKDAIDLAIILVPARNIPKVLEECGEKKIGAVIVQSGGFREFDGAPSELEDRVLSICRQYGMRLIGPNCMGVINRENGLCCPFLTYVPPFYPGGLSVISQSGGVGMSYAMDLTNECVGLNKFVSYGNGLDINEVDLIDYLGRDFGTTVISAYIEGITNGRDFLRVISRQAKPVVVLKSNKRKSAHPVAASHTAVLSGDTDILLAALKQVGVLSVPDTMVWGNVSKQLTLPFMKGNRLAILSRSGGHAVLAADAAGKYGFELPRFPQHFFDACKQYFEHSVINLQNPLDCGQIFYQPVLAHLLEETLKLDEIDGVVMIHSYNGSDEDHDQAHQFLGQIMPLMKKYDKPVSTVLFTDPGERHFVGQNYRLPTFNTPHHGVQAMAYSRDALRLAERRRPFDQAPEPPRHPEASALVKQIKAAGRHPSMQEAFRILEACGVQLAPYGFARTRLELVSAARKLGFPLVVKDAVSPLAHKSDVGAVQLDIRNETELMAAWDTLDANARQAGNESGLSIALVQAMSRKGDPEILVGGKRDLSFGPVVIAGMGGVLTDIIKDVSIRVAPLTAADANEMLEETRAIRLLEGFRGSKPSDTYALIELILAVSRLMSELDDVMELDLNPVLVHPAGHGLTVVDARMKLVLD